MKLVRIPFVAALLVLAATLASAQDPAGPPPGLHPETIVSHVVDGPTPDGAVSRSTIFVTNAGGVPLGADVAFVPDSGEPVSIFGIPFIAPGGTIPVETRAIVGPDAPELVTGTARVRFHL